LSVMDLVMRNEIEKESQSETLNSPPPLLPYSPTPHFFNEAQL